MSRIENPFGSPDNLGLHTTATNRPHDRAVAHQQEAGSVGLRCGARDGDNSGYGYGLTTTPGLLQLAQQGGSRGRFND